jgi:sterol desaturase/sphingolipid hydroxylase (fatty acid hydroxylase superfamily)
MSFDTDFLIQAAYYLSFNLTKAVTALLQRDSYLYWPFVLCALLVALGVAYASHVRHGESFLAAIRAGFSRKLWWHASARADYRIYFVNALVLPALFAAVLFTDRHVAQWLESAFGGAGAAAGAEPTVATRVAFTLVFFFAYDLGRFAAHTLLHDVALLWEFHKVHHSAETLNPLTTFRAHPVDLAVMVCVPALTTGAAAWLFNRISAVPVSFYSFLGLHVLIFAFNLIGILRHSHVWLHYGPVWGKWLISPAHHQLHHSCEPEHIGVNRGFELAVWDRLYGTLCVPGRKGEFRMGLGDGSDAQWHNVRRMYVAPFVNAGKLVATLGRSRKRRALETEDRGALSAGLPREPRG